jgi:signal transduction histidine kinase
MFQHSFISDRHEHRLLGLVLITLHSILWWDFYQLPLTAVLLRLLVATHFLVVGWWQPLWGKVTVPKLTQKILLLVAVAIIIIIPLIELITLWQLALLALLSGRDLATLRDRIVNLLAIVFLSLELLILNLPVLFHVKDIVQLYQFIPTINWPIQLGLLTIPLSFLFISTKSSREENYYIDFFHAITVTMFIIIMGLGSLTLIAYQTLTPPIAIFAMSISMVLFILIFSWLWMIFAGEEGIAQIWSRHLLKIGNTLERTLDQWLTHFIQSNQYQNLSPQEFLQEDLEQLTSLPWIAGIAWQSVYEQVTVGQVTREHVVITIQTLEVTIYTHSRITASQYFQIKILIQILEYFHQAKRREAAFAQQARMHAIHETGAKLIHDIKNLLQSLHAITSVIETRPLASETSDVQEQADGNSIKLDGQTLYHFQKQMPRLTQRLKRTLDKLQQAGEFATTQVPVSFWWGNLKARYHKRQIEFIRHTDYGQFLIPEDLFDNVAENLLQNALQKRQRESQLAIQVELSIEGEHIHLTVSDNGSKIPDEIYRNLLHQPVPSQNGFGIGLYQAVKQLTPTGYELKILANVDGDVCFELTNVDSKT